MNTQEYKKRRSKAKEREYSVVKSNALIQQGRFHLTTQEQKILLYIVSKIKPEDEQFKSYTFNVLDFCKACEIYRESGKAYTDIKDSLKALRDKSLWVEMVPGQKTTLAWFSRVTIHENSGDVEVYFDEGMQPFLLQLKKHFTQYGLHFILAMQSQYSIRLYELLKSYEYKGSFETTIDEFKMSMGAEKYKQHNDFKRFVLETASREINGYTDLTFEYELEKTGRQFTKIIFKIKPIKGADEFLLVQKNLDKKKAARKRGPKPVQEEK